MRTFLSGTGLVGASLLIVVMSGQPGTAPVAPDTRKAEAPRSFVDTTFPRLGSRTIHVAAGGDLQKALDDARGGDMITLEPRAIYRGPFTLRSKDTAGWIVVATSAFNSGLPGPGRRIDPAFTPAPKLIASSGAVIRTDGPAHHFRFVGLEIAPAEGVFLHALVELGHDETRADALPHHIIFDRCYLHGDPKRGARRGIAMNSRDSAVVDSYLSDFKEAGADSQAIAGWNGTGPFRIANSYLEASGENIMFGGADPAIRDLVPADIEIRQNHLAKPLRWKVGHESFEGTEWSVKNLFELKNARRVLVEGNVLEYNWPQAQNGFAILFTVRNQDGRAPWSTIEDVVFTNNLVRHVGSGINILGRDDNHPSQRVQRLAIRNNLFLDVGGDWGHGRLFQLLDGTHDVVIDHNTALQTGDMLFGGDGPAHTGFVFENNIALHNGRAITGGGSGKGLPTLTRYFPASIVRRNVIVGGAASEFPPDNFFPRELDEVGFASYRAGQYTLTRTSPYARAGTDGRDPGADLDASRQTARAFGPILDLAGTRAPSTFGLAELGRGRPAALIFWLAVVLVGYVYVGYPLLVMLGAALWRRTTMRAPIEPHVSIVIAANNEGRRIAARIENLLALDYPREKLDIIIGSDGSTDDTVVRAHPYESAGVTVHAFFTRRGKPAVLNDLVATARGEIVVFADARQRFDPGAIRALVSNFADPTVGAAGGELMLTAGDPDAVASHGACFYWRYEKCIRSSESRLDSTVGTTGAIYAIRRELFQPIPDDTVLDDVLIPLSIVRRGYRVLFDPDARAYDRAASAPGQEFSRKTRTIAGTFQLFSRERWLLNPLRNRLWFQTLSHKGLRLTLPALHVAIFAANLALADLWPYRLLLAAQLIFYTSAVAGGLQRQAGRRTLLVTVAHTMCLLTWATIVGFMRMVTHDQPVTWERVSSRTRTMVR